MSDRSLLARKRIAVTGANRGLGAALAEAFVAAGAEVIVHARTGACAAEACARADADAWVAGDLADATLGPRLAMAAQTVGGLDALVLNAGMLGPMGPMESIDFDTFRQVMEVNVDAQLRLFVACLPQLLAARGVVIWLSSGVGRFGAPNYGAYLVSKHAVEGLSRLAHAEYAARGLVSVAIAPGMVQTDMLRAALGKVDVSDYTEPAVAAGGFVRMLTRLFGDRRDELAGASLDVSDF